MGKTSYMCMFRHIVVQVYIKFFKLEFYLSIFFFHVIILNIGRYRLCIDNYIILEGMVLC